jgi:hypothetical protein
VAIQVKDIPTTLTGKKMEVPVRKLLLGVAGDQTAVRNGGEARALHRGTGSTP